MKTTGQALVAAAILFAGACASRGTPSGLQPDGSEFNSVVRLHRDLPGGGGRALYLRNNYVSRGRHFTMEVVWIALRECHNVGEVCGGRMNVSVTIPYGETRQVLTVLPDDPDQPLSFDWTYRVRWVAGG